MTDTDEKIIKVGVEQAQILLRAAASCGTCEQRLNQIRILQVTAASLMGQIVANFIWNDFEQAKPPKQLSVIREEYIADMFTRLRNAIDDHLTDAKQDSAELIEWPTH